MKRVSQALSSVVAATVSFAAIAAMPSTQPSSEPNLYAITSWGDLIACYGPGTDPSMDTPEALENMIRFWKGRGYKGVYMRTDLGQIDALIRRNPITEEGANESGMYGNSNPAHAWLYKYIDRVQEEFDFHRVGSAVSPKHRFEWWAWHPHIYSDGARETDGYPGKGHIWPWTYISKYKFDHPEIATIDRKGNAQWMVREYAYPGARKSMVEEFQHMAKTFGIKRFIACMRSEASQIQHPPDKADRYGFNQPVVEDMKRLHGVDILTDPRFDVDGEAYNPKDPMVQKWHELRGSYITQLYRELRQGLKEVDPDIELAVTLSGDHVGPPLGNWRLDWRSWVDEGLIDAIITPVFFEATTDNEAKSKNYLTHVREDIGVIPYQTIRSYIDQSKHPGIKLIATMGPPYLFENAPEGTDGWRIDAWYSMYTLAWYQRWWEQCVKDVEETGHIAYLKQNFDEFPAGSAGFAGGWGDYRYNPAIRACPGAWYQFGTGGDGKPVPTTEQARTGLSMKLTAGDDASSALNGLHRSMPDRSGIFTTVDNAITNGQTVFEFWIYRATDESGVTAYLLDEGKENDVAVRILPDSGKIAYSTSENTSKDSWKTTDVTVPSGEWQCIAITADLDKGTYAVTLGDKEKGTVGEGIRMGAPTKRFFEHPNENIPIEVPGYKMFRQVKFVPSGEPGSAIYVDDVTVNWTPTLHWTRARTKSFFHDDFERHAADAPLNNLRTRRDGSWTTHSDAGPGAFTLTNDTSFGEGVNALLATAGGTAVAKGEALRHIPNSYIVIDLDIFVRSDKDYPYMLPDPTTTSKHWSMVGLRRKNSDDPAAVALASRGTWWLWDGTQYVNSKARVAYDVWNHVQLTVDAPTGKFKCVVQPLGEMPTLVGYARLGEAIVVNTDLEFFIRTSETENHISLYDNIKVTAGARP